MSIFQATDPCRSSLTVLHCLQGKQAEHNPPGPRECNDPPTTVKHILTTEAQLITLYSDGEQEQLRMCA